MMLGIVSESWNIFCLVLTIISKKLFVHDAAGSLVSDVGYPDASYPEAI
jgi:K+-transporting ATPase c subunit